MPLSNLIKYRKERLALEKRGGVEAKRIGRIVYQRTMDAYTGGLPVTDALTTALDAMEGLVVDAMVASDLMARVRSLEVAGRHLTRNQKAFGPYDAAIQFVRDRLKLNEEQIQTLRRQYGPVAVNVTNNMSEFAEAEAQKAVQDIIQQNMHIKEGMARLRVALEKVGVTGVRPWLLENLTRSQIHIAYGAGRWNAMQDPDIQEILWGWVYSAVGDDRTRPTHMALDGTRLPKNDPRWSSIWPPNGYSCRCETVEIFTDDPDLRIKEPPETIQVKDGEETETIIVQPDAGWHINHGQIYADAGLMSPTF